MDTLRHDAKNKDKHDIKTEICYVNSDLERFALGKTLDIKVQGYSVPNFKDKPPEIDLILNTQNRQKDIETVTTVKQEQMEENNDKISTQIISKQFMKTIKLNRESYSCGICKAQFLNSDDLFLHEKVHDEDESAYDGRICRQESKTRAKHPCPHCRQMVTFGDLVKHRCHYFWEDSYCGLCFKKFTFLSQLNKHKCPMSNNRFTCDVCKEIICTTKDLNKHKLKHGLQEASFISLHWKIINSPFICHICGTVFHERQAFRRHCDQYCFMPNNTAVRIYNIPKVKRKSKANSVIISDPETLKGPIEENGQVDHNRKIKQKVDAFGETNDTKIQPEETVPSIDLENTYEANHEENDITHNLNTLIELYDGTTHSCDEEFKEVISCHFYNNSEVASARLREELDIFTESILTDKWTHKVVNLVRSRAEKLKEKYHAEQIKSKTKETDHAEGSKIQKKVIKGIVIKPSQLIKLYVNKMARGTPGSNNKDFLNRTPLTLKVAKQILMRSALTRKNCIINNTAPSNLPVNSKLDIEAILKTAATSTYPETRVAQIDKEKDIVDCVMHNDSNVQNNSEITDTGNPVVLEIKEELNSNDLLLDSLVQAEAAVDTRCIKIEEHPRYSITTDVQIKREPDDLLVPEDPLLSDLEIKIPNCTMHNVSIVQSSTEVLDANCNLVNDVEIKVERDFCEESTSTYKDSIVNGVEVR